MASKPAPGTVSCSVCLEHVSDEGERSIAKLKCGHHFHLDCIGSAFNAKGSMQCPNCRHVEDGRWLYASGCRPQVDDFSLFDDASLSLDDEEYEVYTSIAEVHPQVSWQWCPYPQFSVTFEDVEHPSAGLPDGDVIVHYLGDPTASSLRARCPILELQQHARHIEEQLQQHVQQFEEQLVVVQSQVESSGGNSNTSGDGDGGGGGNGGGSGGVLGGGSVRGPPRGGGFPPPVERTGWLSQHLPAPSQSAAVGMMNDVGLSSLPIERFRWSAQANRSEPVQPRFSGPPENTPTSWHSPPCPQHGFSTGVGSATAPGAPNSSGSTRRSRHRNHGGNSSSSSGGGGGVNRLSEGYRGSRRHHHQELGHGGAAGSGNVWQNHQHHHHHRQQQQQQHHHHHQQQQQMPGFEAVPEYSGHSYSWLIDSPPPAVPPSNYPPFGHLYEPEFFYGRQPGFNPFASRGYYQQPR